MTPEGKVKAKLKRFLKDYNVWTDWPVPSGYGKSTLDCQIINKGRVAWVETKAPGQEMTLRQRQLFDTLVRHGCFCVVIDSCDTTNYNYEVLREWLDDPR